MIAQEKDQVVFWAIMSQISQNKFSLKEKRTMKMIAQEKDQVGL